MRGVGSKKGKTDKRFFSHKGEDNPVSYPTSIVEINEGVTPSPQLYSLLLAMCADRRRATEGKIVHAHILNNNHHHHHHNNNTNNTNNNTPPVEIDDILACGLITMYAKCVGLSEAMAVFNDRSRRRETRSQNEIKSSSFVAVNRT